MPVAVGSAVEVRKISMSPRYIRARRSNCRPKDVTVRFIVIALKEHDGGM